MWQLMGVIGTTMGDKLGRECERCGDDPIMWFAEGDGFAYACGENECLIYAEQLVKPLPGA